MNLNPNFHTSWPLILEALGGDHCEDNVRLAAAATIQVECPAWTPMCEKRANPARQPALWKLQERYWPSGYYGRGFLQHTWKSNYARLEQALGLPLLEHPDLLLQTDIAAKAFAWQFKADGAARAAQAAYWARVRRIINGPGMHGLGQFLQAIQDFKGIV
jgi:hypothetical protein